MYRITNKMLQARVDELNELTGNPLKPYDTDTHPIRANIGNYHIDGAYGGVALHQMMNDGGGVHDVFRVGHTTKRDLFNMICAMIEGVKAA